MCYRVTVENVTQHEKHEMRKIQMAEKQEFWDIYNEKKERTGRTMTGV